MSREIEDLQNEVYLLKSELKKALSEIEQSYYFSNEAMENWNSLEEIPLHGHPAQTVKKIIINNHNLDFNQDLNTSSYVNVSFEEEEQEVAKLGMSVNLADQTVYPNSFQMHNKVVNMVARLWNCPMPDDYEKYGVYAGAGTVGSTEACLLAGLALKFRWRKWYARRHQKSDGEVLAIRPNIVISSCFQAAWEKLFKYLDIEPRILYPSFSDFKINPKEIEKIVDDKTIGVVCIMGNHYGGQYDPVWEVDSVVQEVNRNKGFQIGIHVDAASGGFIAPFQEGLPAWDFRLPSVLSISTSGHKYGESVCGTGWVIWRERKDLSEHVAISVTYLGGNSDSYTLNFSRPASGVYVQYYKLLRYGKLGYIQVCENMMKNAEYIRNGLREMKFEGKPRFQILDDGNKFCLPVVTARLNPDCGFSYDDIDLQHVLSQHHWYVSGYKMGFHHPESEEWVSLFKDEKSDATMFRIVVKSNLTRDMAENLLDAFKETFAFMDSVDFSKLHGFEFAKLRHKDQKHPRNHC